LNVHRVSDVRQVEIYTAEMLITDHNPFEVAIENVAQFSYLGTIIAKQELIQEEIKRRLN
jgi:hypothetical protein